MAWLQNMVHNIDGHYENFVHVVDEAHNGGEYTACGIAISDSSLDYEGYKQNGEQFKGSIKKCTCSDCLKTIYYYKSLR